MIILHCSPVSLLRILFPQKNVIPAKNIIPTFSCDHHQFISIHSMHKNTSSCQLLSRQLHTKRCFLDASEVYTNIHLVTKYGQRRYSHCSPCSKLSLVVLFTQISPLGDSHCTKKLSLIFFNSHYEHAHVQLPPGGQSWTKISSINIHTF